MSPTETGREAESAAADYLVAHGYSVKDRNWKTPQCEIDIVAEKDGCIYFVEVKYRASSRQGGGLDHITSKKRTQMQFAAELWTTQYNWTGDVSLAGVEVGGKNFEVINFIDSIY